MKPGGPSTLTKNLAETFFCILKVLFLTFRFAHYLNLDPEDDSDSPHSRTFQYFSSMLLFNELSFFIYNFFHLCCFDIVYMLHITYIS